MGKRRLAKATSHQECLKLVCLLCRAKASHQIQGKQLEILTRLDTFNSFREHLPSALCHGCRLKLQKGYGCLQPKNLAVLESQVKETKKLCEIKPHQTRAMVDCLCSICKIAKANVGQFSNFIPRKKKKGRPTTNLNPAKKAKKETPKKRCGYCDSVIAPGLPHLCNERTRYENLAARMSPRVSEKVAASVLQPHLQKAEASGSGIEKLSLGTGGRRQVSYISKQPIQEASFSHEFLGKKASFGPMFEP